MEFALTSIVLLLLVSGIVDLGRSFYYQVSMYGAVREGARHGAWFEPGSDSNPYLDDSDVLAAVNQNLTGSGYKAVFPNGGTNSSCPITGNAFNNPPLASGLYPSSNNQPWLYICYRLANGSYSGSRTSAPNDNSYLGGDIETILVMNYGIVTPLAQSLFGNGIPMVAYSHMTIQGTPP